MSAVVKKKQCFCFHCEVSVISFLRVKEKFISILIHKKEIHLISKINKLLLLKCGKYIKKDSKLICNSKNR